MPSSVREWLLAEGLTQRGVDALLLAFDLGGVLVLAWVANFVAKRILLRAVVSLSAHTKTDWDDHLARRKVFRRLSHLAPAIVIYLVGPIVLAGYGPPGDAARQASLIYMVLVTVWVLSSALNAVNDRAAASNLSRDLPLKSFVQVFKIVLYVLTGIAVVSLLIGKSPLLLLSGLGAMTAVLMLVFRDAILGLVAGVQLSANTITTIPTYALISESFKNWRGYQHLE